MKATVRVAKDGIQWKCTQDAAAGRKGRFRCGQCGSGLIEARIGACCRQCKAEVCYAMVAEAGGREGNAVPVGKPMLRFGIGNNKKLAQLQWDLRKYRREMQRTDEVKIVTVPSVLKVVGR